MATVTKTDLGGCEFWLKNLHTKCWNKKYHWHIEYNDTEDRFKVYVYDSLNDLVAEAKRSILKDALRSLCEELR